MIGFSRIIKIPGKSKFDQLEAGELARLIESLLEGGNESFDETALSEFLHADVHEPLVKSTQNALKAHAFLDAGPDKYPPVNEKFLVELAARLRAGQN